MADERTLLFPMMYDATSVLDNKERAMLDLIISALNCNQDDLSLVLVGMILLLSHYR